MKRSALTALGLVLGTLVSAEPVAAERTIATPPPSLRLDAFYSKYATAAGLPVVSSAKVPDDALRAAADVVEHMLAERVDIAEALLRKKVRVAVMAQSEKTTDIPEHRDLKPKAYWDKRARGLGGTSARPAVSCAEENLLGYRDDPYRGESILIHEFAHTIHVMALIEIDGQFDRRLGRLFERSAARGLWAKTYAARDAGEYWAEGVQSWFDANLEADPPDGIHNHVNTREELEAYDPDLAELIAEVFGATDWRFGAASPPGSEGPPDHPRP